MTVIGITGGIATGKSSALDFFRKLGAKTIDADEIVRKLYKKESIKELLVLNFGGKAIDGNGNVNRKFLAERIFSERKARLLLNAMVHPIVNAELKKCIAAFRKSKRMNAWKIKKNKNSRLLVVEVPLLFESNSEKMYDKVVVVGSARKKQLERMARGGISKSNAEKRLAAQMPIGKKAKKADFLIQNNGSKKELETEVKKVLAKLVFSQVSVLPKLP